MVTKAGASVKKTTKKSAEKPSKASKSSTPKPPSKTPKQPSAQPIGSSRKKVDTATVDLGKITTAQSLLSYGVEPYIPKEGEPYMHEAQKAHFERLLLAWLNALLQGGDATISDLREASETPADLSDQASKEEAFALELRTRDRERKLIAKVEEALRKLKTDDYGYCEECGIEIGVRRLEARPTATLCIDCKTIAEIKERQQRGN